MQNIKNGVRRCRTCHRFGCDCKGARARRDREVKTKNYGKMPKKG